MYLKMQGIKNRMPKMVIAMMLADMFLKGILYGMYLQRKIK
jgi:hypothetical protein